MGAEQRLFDFSRTLPVPFINMRSKKVRVQSQYGENTESTLCASAIKAIIAFCKCKDGSAPGAVGMIDHRCVAEYKSSTSPEDYHLAVYNPLNGDILAAKYNTNTELPEVYTTNRSAHDGSVIIFAMMPALLDDEEFDTNFNNYYNEYSLGYPDMDKATNYMGILCDNVYRRVKNEACPAHIKANIEQNGNMTKISTTHLDSGSFAPRTVIAGEFSIFSQARAAFTPFVPTEENNVNDFVGKFVFDTSRSLSAYEESLVPKLEPWYILPDEIITLCRHAHMTTGKSTPMRNFELRGSAGTGKTIGVKAFAAGVNLPYFKYTCSANTEIYDMIGQVFPSLSMESTGNVELDHEIEELKKMGGITYGNIAKLMKMPDAEEIEYEPVSSYAKITGKAKADATVSECISAVLQIITDKMKCYYTSMNKEEKDSGQQFIYTETDFIKALKNGYVIELQEPNVIIQPGVLVGLNGLLETSGSITLPTGEIINRHPDSVVIQTTNGDYEGCRERNQAVQDRMSMVLELTLPSSEIMVQRAMKVTGCEDDVQVSKMVQVVNDMAHYCEQNGITDGNCGMRSLFDWIISSEITGDPYTSAIYTVINKAASDERDRINLTTSVLEPIFPMQTTVA